LKFVVGCSGLDSRISRGIGAIEKNKRWDSHVVR
jgi:hypothetical protein